MMKVEDRLTVFPTSASVSWWKQRKTLKFLTAFSVIMLILKPYESSLLLYRLFHIYPAKNNPPSPMRGIKLCWVTHWFLAPLLHSSVVIPNSLPGSSCIMHLFIWGIAPLGCFRSSPSPPHTVVFLQFLKRYCSAAPPCVGFLGLQRLSAKIKIKG